MHPSVVTVGRLWRKNRVTMLPFVYAVDQTHSKKTSSVLSSTLREFVLVSLTAVGNALSQCSKELGISGDMHIILLHRIMCSLGSSWNLEEGNM